MAMQFSVDVRNARLDSIETTISTLPILQLRTGAKPANCAAASTGTLIAEMTLPSDWMSGAASGVKGLSGVWSDPLANAGGVVAHFRVLESTGTDCKIQGTAGDVGTEDLVLTNATVVISEPISVTQFDITDGNA